MTDRTSPLRDKPLRQAGQSVQEHIDRVLIEKLDTHLLMIGGVTAMAGYDWAKFLLNSSPHPIYVTIAAALVAAWYLPKIIKIRRDVRRARQGRDGERMVAEVLDRLREEGAVVFHDIKSNTFNVDHVVASRKGIFAIETKTYSKRKGSRVQYDGTTLSLDGYTPIKDPVEQSRAIARWVTKSLREGTAKDYRVKPVVVFPGWFVNPVREHGGSDVWVLNPEGLPTFVRNEPDRLTEEEFRGAVFHLSRIARSV